MGSNLVGEANSIKDLQASTIAGLAPSVQIVTIPLQRTGLPPRDLGGSGLLEKLPLGLSIFAYALSG